MKMLLILLLTSASLHATVLKLNITNLSSDRGEIAIAIFDHKQQSSFPNDDHNALIRGFFTRNELPLSIELPFGEYAISVFQDNNDSGDLDTNLFGIPQEPFGFSNEAIIRFGPPSYDQAKIKFTKPQQTFSIRLNR